MGILLSDIVITGCPSMAKQWHKLYDVCLFPIV